MKFKLINLVALCAWMFFGVGNAHADIQPNSLFADHAVLQRDKPLPIWGMGTEGEEVKVTLGNESVSTTVKDGKWIVTLSPLPAGGPHTMLIRGANRIELKDILVGDVWVCSGQSNMERNLGPRRGQKDIENWQTEVAAANYPQIREYIIAPEPRLAPAADTNGRWRVCSPETVPEFSAVGYFFARDIHRERKVPVGMLFAALGGTAAQAWTSYSSMAKLSDTNTRKLVSQQIEFINEYPGITIENAWEQWFQRNDPGSKPESHWSQLLKDEDAAEWRTIQLPEPWGKSALPKFDGVVWFRRTIDLPVEWVDKAVIPHLNLGRIREADKTWINGIACGSGSTSIPRSYRVPPKTLVTGRNVITMRVICTNRAFEAGFLGSPEQMVLSGGIYKDGKSSSLNSIPLAGEWMCRTGVPVSGTSKIPSLWTLHKNMPAVLYNRMISPIVNYPIKGVIWYQGEQDVANATLYRELFPMLITDWRIAWKQGDFPFLFVQIAPYKTMTPELREAQLLTLGKMPNTAMAVTVDCGDAEDIHPIRKQPVGTRLALAARALAYGEKLEHSGPLYEKADFQNGQAVVHFNHVGSGLTAKDGTLRGFTVAGADRIFVPAPARIEGTTVIVQSEAVKQPVAVRYGWENVPDVNLFNVDGLPASPFRSDIGE
ncbi:MAG: sialate O-acetylesterase [Lentisphaerota bacterium]